jgi:hypothetical protein
MSLTTDPNDPALKMKRPDGQNEAYLVLSEEERAAGRVRPLRNSYRHTVCGTVTKMPDACAETYSVNPGFYGATFCAHCKTHLALVDADGNRVFEWIGADGKTDGTFVGE